MSDLHESTLIILILAIPNARIGHKMTCIQKSQAALLYEIIRSFSGTNSMGLMSHHIYYNSMYMLYI